MKLRDLKEIFGISVEQLKSDNKKYRMWTFILYFVDVLLILAATTYMFFNGVQMQYYGIALVIVCVLINFAIQLKLSGGTRHIYMFRKKHLNCSVVEKRFAITDSQVDQILCDIGAPPGNASSLEEFQKVVNSFCRGSIKNALAVSIAFTRYEISTGDIRCLFVKTGKQQLFLSFASLEDVENKEGE